MSKKFALEIVMLTCCERESTRRSTLRSLGRTDWFGHLELMIDPSTGPPSLARMLHNFKRALQWAASRRSDFVLFVEDDLIFNRHLAHNLEAWHQSFRPRDVGLLYQTTLGQSVGTQGVVAAPETWALLEAGNQTQPIDAWIRQAVPPQKLRRHNPSLVEHHDVKSTVGHISHRARNFDPEYRA